MSQFIKSNTGYFDLDKVEYAEAQSDGTARFYPDINNLTAFAAVDFGSVLADAVAGIEALLRPYDPTA